MSNLVLTDSFVNLFPDAEVGILAIHGVDNSDHLDEASLKEIEDLLVNANKEALKWTTDDPVGQWPVVACWREAYQKFKKKKDARVAIENLLKRAKNDNPVGTINPLVDIYNAMSLTHGLPFGAEDVATIKGDMKLMVTEGGDEFLALGDEENNPTLPGELAYIDDAGAVCRCFNWRDGVRTMLTEKTTDMVLISENVVPERHDDLVKALDETEALILKYLGGTTVTKTILNKDSREALM